jgi:Histidine kinase-, DNA gyrase B-, and HSP90-like ATPase
VLLLARSTPKTVRYGTEYLIAWVAAPHFRIVQSTSDTPSSIPAKTRNQLEAFYATKSNGLGMGLAICRSIIDAHGGRLWADANEPRGAVFQFTLPGADPSSGIFCRPFTWYEGRRPDISPEIRYDFYRT